MQRNATHAAAVMLSGRPQRTSAAQQGGFTDAQVAREAAELRRQQGLLRTAFEGEAQRAAAECAGGVEAMQARWRQVSPCRLAPLTLAARLWAAAWGNHVQPHSGHWQSRCYGPNEGTGALVPRRAVRQVCAQMGYDWPLGMRQEGVGRILSCGA